MFFCEKGKNCHCTILVHNNFLKLTGVDDQFYEKQIDKIAIYVFSFLKLMGVDNQFYGKS